MISVISGAKCYYKASHASLDLNVTRGAYSSYSTSHDDTDTTDQNNSYFFGENYLRDDVTSDTRGGTSGFGDGKAELGWPPARCEVKEYQTPTSNKKQDQCLVKYKSVFLVVQAIILVSGVVMVIASTKMDATHSAGKVPLLTIGIAVVTISILCTIGLCLSNSETNNQIVNRKPRLSKRARHYESTTGTLDRVVVGFSRSNSAGGENQCDTCTSAKHNNWMSGEHAHYM